MTADRIAEVVADIRAGRVSPPPQSSPDIHQLLLPQVQRPQPVIDCTAVFDLQRRMSRIDLYGDYPTLTPPWERALLCYVNTFQNVIVMSVEREDWAGHGTGTQGWRSTNPVDWSQVRWIANTSIWIGGRSGSGAAIPTTGAVHLLRHAIRADGAPEDINWIAVIPGDNPDTEVDGNSPWLAATLTLTASLNFLNCSNVSTAEPPRPRPERRRIARTGVQVQSIVVRPPGRRSGMGAGNARPLEACETALSPVRGHFVHYGEQYGRGLLFGRYPGKFWVPDHVRGAGEPTIRDYRLAPGDTVP